MQSALRSEGRVRYRGAFGYKHVQVRLELSYRKHRRLYVLGHGHVEYRSPKRLQGREWSMGGCRASRLLDTGCGEARPCSRSTPAKAAVAVFGNGALSFIPTTSLLHSASSPCAAHFLRFFPGHDE